MNKPMLDRVAPNDFDAEAYVIRCMMHATESSVTIPKAIKILEAMDFYNTQHQVLYEAISSLFNNGTPVDIVTLSSYLDSRNSLENMPDLVDEVDGVYTTANVEYYAAIVRDLSVRRKLIRLGAKIYDDGFKDDLELSDLLDSSEKGVLGLRRGTTNNIGRIKESMKETFNEVNAVYHNKGSLIGLSSGLADLDKITSGYQNGDYIVIAGRPSMGKSTFVQGTVQHLAVEKKVPCLLFSAEMSKRSVTLRILSAEARIPLHSLRTGHLSENDWSPLTLAAGRIVEAPIILDDTASIKLGELRAKAHQAVSEYGIKLIVVDYLQLVRGASKNGKREETDEVSAGLKAIGRDLDVPIIALSQLNRMAETRPDKRPQLSDLRESGSIEQDADVVMLLYRDSYYNKELNDHTTEVIVAKQRNGPTGVVKVLFDPTRMRFLNLEKYKTTDF
jgi:replicative DNA helicase